MKAAIGRLFAMVFYQIRLRLVLLVVIAGLPALMLTLYTGVLQKRLAVEQAKREFLSMTKLAAVEQERGIDNTRQLLGILVQLPEVRSMDPRRCDPLLARLLKQNPLYASFGVVDHDGMLVCSGLPFKGHINDSDRLWFKRAVETRSFSVGEFQISRTANVPSVHFSCPFYDNEGKLLGVTFAGIDLNWIGGQLLSRAELPEGTLCTLVDSSGVIMARSDYPEKWVGKSIAEIPLAKTILTSKEVGTLDSAGIDGVNRLFAFTPLKIDGGTIAGYLILGIPPDIVYADANRIMMRNLAYLGVVSAFAVVLAWFFGGALVMRRTRSLIATANSLRAGDLAARTNADHQFGEFTPLAKAFDEMAYAIQKQIADLEKAHAELVLDDARLETLLKLNGMVSPPLQEITDFALESAVRLTQSKIGYLAFLNEDESVMTMHAWSRSAMAECSIADKPIVYPVADTGLWGEAVRQRQAIITNDYEAPNPLKKSYPDGHVRVLRHMNTPVFEGDRIVLVAGVGNKEEPYEQADVRQLALLMQGMWRLVQHKRIQEELERYRVHLEELVATRTSELEKSNDQLNAEIIVRKKAEETLRHVVQDLQDAQVELKSTWMLLIQAEKMESIGRMAAGVAHEVKNPLAILMMSLDFLSIRLTTDDASLRDVLDDMRKAVIRADTIIRGLLDFSAPGMLNLTMLDLNDLVGKALVLVRHLLNMNHVKLVDELGDGLPQLSLDGSKIEQVLVNLLTNAIDAMPLGGTLTVRTRLERFAERARDPGSRERARFQTGDMVVTLEIEDTGSGISPDAIRHIFDPFFTTKETGKGTGLGLAVSSRIVEMHEGAIEIANRPEGGVRARLIFQSGGTGNVPPCEVPDSDDAAGQSQPRNNKDEREKSIDH